MPSHASWSCLPVIQEQNWQLRTTVHANFLQAFPAEGAFSARLDELQYIYGSS